MNFTDKVAVVTGGANGIGRCIVETFLSVGARVAFIDIDEESGASIAANYTDDKVLFVAGDIADEDTLKFFTEKVTEFLVKWIIWSIMLVFSLKVVFSPAVTTMILIKSWQLV